ncbi:MAG: PD-(D/E)XK nuclease family protein [Solirubrobacteraceae bacterium]|jgi:DNA helicase-2/ATP-dependent DNA helicase PcrA
MERAEVRDVVAWTRLLADPNDASAVVRALARPPIELRQVDLARVIQIARRRKLDMVAALAVATESPQVPPEARARIQRFMELHRAATEALDAARPDLLARAALGAERDEPRGGASSPARSGPDEALRDMQRIVREEVLADVARIGGRLSELRLDTDLDISHGVARYLELLKLSALAQRPAEQSVADALADVNARLLAAVTAMQREILQSSPLDGTLTTAFGSGAPAESMPADGADGEVGGGGDDERAAHIQAARVQAVSPRGEPSLGPFLPRRGGGLALSASDIETYRSCPLRYKFARVLRIPTEPTIGQRFGIVVHQVLERYHVAGGETLTQLLDLFEVCWRRAGFRDGESERELRGKARAALERYHARLHGQDSEPVWFERQFSLRIGPHHLRGRVDRVDRLPAGRGVDGGETDTGERYELIDYKTSRPRTAEQLRDDVQLSLYALAARESWQLEAASRAYYYVLDDLIVRLPGDTDEKRVTETVLEVGEGIMGQRFDPTPSRAACSICDFRIVCPAAER